MTFIVGRKVDKEVRTDEVLLFHEDKVAPNIIYYGRTELFSALDSEPVWQIKRVVVDGTIRTTTYANSGKYNCVWDDRTTYFAPAPAPAPADVIVSRPSGLTVAGLTTTVSLNDSSWNALPAVALANRNQINIQNETAFDIKLRYDNTFVGYAGVTVASGSERQYAITDDIIIYAKMAPGGSGNITIEELA